MIWAGFWFAVFIAASLTGKWIEHADRCRARANAALRNQAEELSAEEQALADRLRALFHRQCELLDEYDSVWGLDRINALPDGERLASKADVAFLEAILALSEREPERGR